MKIDSMKRVARAALVLGVCLGLGAAYGAKPGPRGGATSPAAAAASASSAAGGLVNLNTANEVELDLLPGVGPAKAQAVLAYRARYGPFKKVEDLVKVKGFGRKTVAKLRPMLTTSGATTFRGKFPQGAPAEPDVSGP